jgi:hypothetical protein
VSYKHNLERYSTALSTIRQKASSNIIVNKELKAHFTKNS